MQGLGVGLAAALAPALLRGQPAVRRPRNVLFLAVDDLRPELPCYGAAHIQAPHIDRLAATGTVFTHAYCQQAVCSPSRTSLMTGLRSDSTRVYDLDTHFRNHEGKALMGYALRDERYRFVEWISPATPVALAPEGTVELYDHQADPREDRNLAADPAQATAVREFRALLRAGWQAARPPA
jgi:arylsulfatase A-like enzyme